MEISVENLYVNIGAQLTKHYNTHARSLSHSNKECLLQHLGPNNMISFGRCLQ